uniref:Uncharacterized protein n=1 Tax=Pseudomonas phage HRDY3 TaxID=3236930 RepID=A0AB39CDV4_9VIRU
MSDGSFKYIVFGATNKNGEEFEIPVLFPKYLTHADMCEASKMVMFRDDYSDLTPGPAISAGFCCVGQKGIECFGESESLKKKSRGEQDSKLFAQYNTYGHGRVRK